MYIMQRLLHKAGCTLRRIGKFLSDDFSDFCSNTVLHGFKYIGDRSISVFGRVLFFASFVFILVYVSTLIADIYAKWDSTPVIVGLSPRPTVITKLPFPAITICNVNQALASKVRNIPRDSVEYSMVQTLCSRSIDGVEPSRMADICNRTLFQNFIREIAQPCEKMFHSCKFGTIMKDCKDIFKPVLTDEGQCCVFNSAHSSFIYKLNRKFESFIQVDGSAPVNWDPEAGYHKPVPKYFYPRVATGIGASMGLSIVLNADVKDYYCSSTNGAGFKLLLHNPIEMPSLRENGLFVNPGGEMIFRIKADRSEAEHDIRSFSIEDRQCVFLSERRLSFFKTYTRRNCEMECQANMSVKLCGCISYYLPRTNDNVPVCSLKDFECLQPILHPTPESHATIEKGSCTALCIQGCFDLTFTPAKFTIPLTSGGYMIKNQRLETYNTSYLKENIAVVHFYYKLSTFNGFMRTRFIGTTEFLSNTGGLIGLLGFSFTAVAEIVYYLILRPLRPVFHWIWIFLVRLTNRGRVFGQKKTTREGGLQELNRSRDSTKKWPKKVYRKKMSGRVSYR